MTQLSRLIAGLLTLASLGIMFHAYTRSANCQELAKDGKDAKKADEKLNPLLYAYLTHTDPEQATAYWRNRVTRAAEKKIIAKANSDYNRFRITDETGAKIIVQAKVLRVDLRVVYIQKVNAIYAWNVGTSLQDALQKELSDAQRVELKLEIDQTYATEMSEEKKK